MGKTRSGQEEHSYKKGKNIDKDSEFGEGGGGGNSHPSLNTFFLIFSGELSESQKEALEDANARANEKEAELMKVKSQVKELNDLVEKFKVEVIGLKDNLK